MGLVLSALNIHYLKNFDGVVADGKLSGKDGQLLFGMTIATLFFALYHGAIFGVVGVESSLRKKKFFWHFGILVTLLIFTICIMELILIDNFNDFGKIENKEIEGNLPDALYYTSIVALTLEVITYGYMGYFLSKNPKIAKPLIDPTYSKFLYA